MPKLPGYVAQCVEALEAAGFEAWTVGGCVRDACMGRIPHDYDVCTNALPEQSCRVFRDRELILTGMKHGTVTVVAEGEPVEITTFRTEGDYRDNRHPQWVKFVPQLRQDLARRDFTVNAMAWSPTRGLQDPFGGREDLERGLIRAVGDPWERFREDSLRILRGIRFAVRYGFAVEEETFRAMVGRRELLASLSRERVFGELCEILPGMTLEQLLRFAPVITALIPELEPMVGFDQHSPHHAYDLYTHTAHVTAGVPADPVLRWAALLHDVGKIDTFTRDETGRGHFRGHARAGADRADEILRRLRAPNAIREEAVELIGHHMTFLEDEAELKRQLRALGRDTLQRLVALQEADMGGKGVGEEGELEQFPRIRAMLERICQEESCVELKDLAVNGHDLLALGFRGKQIGIVLERLLDRVVRKTLPNEKDALLDAAKEYQEDNL